MIEIQETSRGFLIYIDGRPWNQMIYPSMDDACEAARIAGYTDTPGLRITG